MIFSFSQLSTRTALLILLPTTLALGAAAVGGNQTKSKPISTAKTQRNTAEEKPKTANKAAVSSAVVVNLTGSWRKTIRLEAGKTVEISVHLDKPSALPPNARIAAEWTLKDAPEIPAKRPEPDFGIPAPSPNWRKVLHALDNDVYLVYRAPQTGEYTLTLTPVVNEEPVGAGTRWREKGTVPMLMDLPAQTPFPAGTKTPVSVSVTPIDAGTQAAQDKLRTAIEAEPNDTPEMAQTIALTLGGKSDVQTWEVTGSADDAEFFDNGKVGKSGEDWYRIEYKGSEPGMLTAQISLPGQFVAARVRAYRMKPGSQLANAVFLPIEEYGEGRDANERVHQQDEEHRANIVRTLKPGETYFLRVEANAPGYQLELRTLRPAPYVDNPRLAVRQAMYTQIGQVDAWLTNRPRGASVDRRLRDTGNLLGTQCMSCHTQSGVWGPAVPIQNGYRVQNIQNLWHMANVMYECLRPTNELKDAANNTSLAPLDIGDGPAGTRAAGFNIVNAERVLKPRKLHARQQVKTANYVMQTADPGGINAAGPGSNIGRVIVWTMATEILKTAWEKTQDPTYFRKMEEKAKNILGDNVQFTDDVALRLHYFHTIFPIAKYAEWVKRAEQQETAAKKPIQTKAGEPEKFVTQVREKLAEDERRLRANQIDDGSWGFQPGTTSDGGKTWKPNDKTPDPSPTALAILGLNSAGYGKDDPTISKGVTALLKMQDSSGRWNKAAQTGFVTSAYALHALARLYPETPYKPKRAEFVPQKGESLLAKLKRVQALALSGATDAADLLIAAAQDENALVRYWAVIGLGATNPESGVAVLTAALGDRTKIVRDAATWAMRQTLLDDKGWNDALTVAEKGTDDQRAQMMQVLGMRADATTTKSSVNWNRLTGLFDRAMHRDPHPAVRAWATKAAWQWWVWNPPVRKSLNASWVRLLERPEPNVLAENTIRYSSQALFIVNGHKANGSSEHQYKELADLFESITKRLDNPPNAEIKSRMAMRLVAVAGTFYATAGGDGGPGQMGYATPNSGEMIGKAALIYLQDAVKANDMKRIQAGIEGGSNVPHQPLTAFLVDYSLKGPEELRKLASEAVGDPRSAKLAAVPEQIEPQMTQIRRGAMEPTRRAQISDPIINLWAKVNWIVPKTEEQQRNFFNILIPKFANYASPEQIAGMTDAAKKAEMQKEMEAAWYLADRLGEVMEKNPDLHLDIVFRQYFPAQFANPLEEHFWVRSVEWLLQFANGMMKDAPTTGAKTAALQDDKPKLTTPPKVDVALTIKDRALQLYLDALKPTANPQTRAAAIRMSNRTALRTNPEVLRALKEVLTFEQDKKLREIIENVLKQGTEKFLPDLIAFLKEEKHASTKLVNGEPQISDVQRDDIIYFRDYVMPELTRQKRGDQQSCAGCHAVVGRVPSLYMKPTDQFGYISVPDLMFNYRVMQSKIRLDDLEKSKFLRKPLNVQDGKEDGHQGGRRFAPTDEGYLILKKWAENQRNVLPPAAVALVVPPAEERDRKASANRGLGTK
jgi:hypothetical protein